MPSFNVMTSVKTPCPNKVTLWGLGLQHMNPGDTTQLVRTPRPSAALPPAPVCLGSSPTARPGPVRRVRNRPTPDPPPRSGRAWCWERRAPGWGRGALALLSLCPSCAPPGPPTWSPWTPWSECSASCGPARRRRHRFCAWPPGPPSVVLSSGAPLPPAASPAALCPGPEAEEEPCLLPGCDRECPVPGTAPLGTPAACTCRPSAPAKPPPHTPSSAVPSGAGGWGPWAPWSSCSRSCGGGLRSRTRACDQPPPQGLGDYCEGPQAQGEACQALSCPGTCQGWGQGARSRGRKAAGGFMGREAGAGSPRGSQPALPPPTVTDCNSTEGAEYSPCGPPCPRSCDDLVVSPGPLGIPT